MVSPDATWENPPAHVFFTSIPAFAIFTFKAPLPSSLIADKISIGSGVWSGKCGVATRGLSGTLRRLASVLRLFKMFV